MKIIYQEWGLDIQTNRRLFLLRGRVGFDVKQVVLSCDDMAYASQEGREVVKRDAYNKLREAFGQDAEKPL